MKCKKCGSIDVIIFFDESVKCSHCDETNTVSYSLCLTCNSIWKDVNGEIVNDLQQWPDLAVIDPFDGAVGFVELGIPVTGTMNEVVHKCIRCEATAFEVKPGTYHCPDCSFEWEVL